MTAGGATNVGIDSDKIYGVYRLDMPLKPRRHGTRKRRRAGRFVEIMPDTYLYCVIFSMSSFKYKLIQILSDKEDVLDETYREEMKTELLEMLKLLTIALKYISKQLEEMMTNPDKQSDNVGTEQCNHCFVCNNYIHSKKNL